MATTPEPAAGHGTTLRPWVGSEVAQLRTVLLHRPGRELERITPANMHALLFDDVPWASRAQAEHDAFAAVLRSRGVRVLEVQELLADTLALEDARAAVLDGTLAAVRTGPFLGPRLREWLDGLSPVELAERLIAGVDVDELPFAVGGGLAAELGGDGGFVLPPLPNQFFTRDTSVWVRDGVGSGAWPRPRATASRAPVSAILRHHPLFAESAPGTARGASRAATSSSRARTGARRPERAHDRRRRRRARRRLFAHGIEEILAFELPLERATMHLDTLMTFVDHDAVVMHPDLDRLDALAPAPERTAAVRPARGRVHRRRRRGAVAHARRRRPRARPRRRRAGGRARAVERRVQRARGRAGVVLGYDRNERTNAALADDGSRSSPSRAASSGGSRRRAVHVVPDRARRRLSARRPPGPLASAA
jgi:arginine deiminase